MSNERMERITVEIDALLERAQAELEGQRYWYPLSWPTYGTPEIVEALESMCAFRTTMREKTQRFEAAFARYQGSAHAIMVNSGSSADLLLSFLLVDPGQPLLEHGDKILIPAVTWPTQIWSALMAGLKVELVDVDPETLNVSNQDLERRITGSTRAVSLVHLLGNPCDMDGILPLVQRHGLVLIEDCCESLGAEWRGTKVGNFGVGAAFSFFFSHHITTMEGGMITTSQADAADRLRILRAHGWFRDAARSEHASLTADIDPRYAFVDWGFNVRPTELQAGFGVHQLERLPGFTERRERLGARFYAAMAGTHWLSGPRVSPHARPIWMALPCMIRKDAPFTRAQLTEHLERAGVETRPIVAGNLARQPVARLFPDLAPGPYPGADEVHRQGFYVGLSPMVTSAAMDRLIETMTAFLARFA